MVTRPKLLVLDEPTEGIQPSIIKDIGRAIRFLREQGGWASCWSSSISILRVSLPTRSCVIDRGEIVVSGAAADLEATEIKRHLTI